MVIKKVKNLIIKIAIVCVYLLNIIAFSNPNINTSDVRQIEDSLPIISPLSDPQLKDYFITMDDFAKSLESSEPLSSSIFGLKDQRIELPSINIELNDKQVSLEKPSFSSFKYTSNSENKEFIIEAVTGVDEKGQNGRVVAKHVLRGFDVASIVADNLLVVIIEKNGKISAIPKSMIIHYGFEAPIPVFRNLNGTPLLFQGGGKVKAEFLTIGSKPISKKEIANPEALTQEYEAGQLLVWQEN
ncbi:MAG: hypothetical protein KDD45_01185, partial [Bdellovibrionales bacterium]|nr:hypothetical protein [Bdellovibrionales bacterium]